MHSTAPAPPTAPVPFVLAIDLGGTHLRVARVAADGAILARRRVATPTDEGPDAVVATMLAEIDRLDGEAATTATSPGEPSRRFDHARAIGVAAPGPLDPRTGVVHEVPNMPGWRGYPLAARLADATGLPVRVHNDANLAGLAEARLGAGKGFDPVIYLTVSTGVGGGIILGGRIFAGSAGLAGELGHMVVHAGGPACNLGHPGCLEALASGTAIARSAREAVANGTPTSLAKVVATEEAEAMAVDAASITAECVAAAAIGGDALARSIYASAGDALGLAIGSFVNIFDPGRIVLGGGVTQAWDLLAPSMWLAVRRVAMAWDLRPIDIVPAALGDDAGLAGAGLWAWEAE